MSLSRKSNRLTNFSKLYPHKSSCAWHAILELVIQIISVGSSPVHASSCRNNGLRCTEPWPSHGSRLPTTTCCLSPGAVNRPIKKQPATCRQWDVEAALAKSPASLQPVIGSQVKIGRSTSATSLHLAASETGSRRDWSTCSRWFSPQWAPTLAEFAAHGLSEVIEQLETPQSSNLFPKFREICPTPTPYLFNSEGETDQRTDNLDHFNSLNFMVKILSWNLLQACYLDSCITTTKICCPCNSITSLYIRCYHS